MSLSWCFCIYYKLPKSDPYAVYLLPVYFYGNCTTSTACCMVCVQTKKLAKKGFCSLMTSLILGLYYKLNWPKRASAVKWLLGTLLYPWRDVHSREKECQGPPCEADKVSKWSSQKTPWQDVCKRNEPSCWLPGQVFWSWGLPLHFPGRQGCSADREDGCQSTIANADVDAI